MALYVDQRYETNEGTVFNLKLDRQDQVTGNVQAGGAAVGRVANRRKTRAKGLAVRQIRLRRQIVAENPAQGIPSVYRYRNVTILTPAVYAAMAKDDVVEHGGSQYVIYQKLPEVNNV